MIEFPDVSNHTPVSLVGAPACIAKATEGTTFTDTFYTWHRGQAVAMGIPFAAYHWVNTADLAGQAAHAYQVVGPGTPVMWDAEAAGSTVPRLLELTSRYRGLGGVASLVYLPRWWWRDHLGAPDLRPLADAGLALISSDYDNAPPDGWAPYGGVTPAVWQFTSTRPFNGRLCDFNRYPGTVEQLRALFAGTPTPPEEEDPMHLVASAKESSIYFAPGFAAPSGRIAAYGLTPDLFAAYQALGLKSVTLPTLVRDCPIYDVSPQPWPTGLMPAHDELVQAAFEGAQRAETM